MLSQTCANTLNLFGSSAAGGAVGLPQPARANPLGEKRRGPVPSGAALKKTSIYGPAKLRCLYRLQQIEQSVAKGIVLEDVWTAAVSGGLHIRQVLGCVLHG